MSLIDNTSDNRIMSLSLEDLGATLVNVKKDCVHQELYKLDIDKAKEYLKKEGAYGIKSPLGYGYFAKSTKHSNSTVTEKYDPIEMRKMRALSFRTEGNFNADPLSPGTMMDTGNEIFAIDDSDSCKICDADTVCGEGVTAKDLSRLDLFYRSFGTEVTICRCVAELSFTSPQTLSMDLVDCDWEPVNAIGVPVFLLNTGEGKRERSLFLILAERETGFTLWEDRINYLSSYRQISNLTYVMNISSNLRRVAGLRFHGEYAAKMFMEKYKAITSDPEDVLWTIGRRPNPGKSKKKVVLEKLKIKNRTKKSDISNPCNFVHLTYLNPDDEIVNEGLTLNTPALSATPGADRPAFFRQRSNTS